MTRRMVLGLSLWAACLGVASCDAPSPTPKATPTVIRLTTGPAGGTLQVIGASLQRGYQGLLSGATIEITNTGGAVDNLVAVQSASADLGITYSDVAYSAFSGKLEQRPERFDRLAAIAVLPVAPLHIVIAHDAPFTSITDLRGKRLGMSMAPGSGSGITARSVLSTVGVPLTSVTLGPLGSDSAHARLKDGSVDAFLQVGLEPIDWIQKALLEGARLLPLTEDQVQRLGQIYPFFRPTVIRKDTYSGLERSVPTIGVDGLLVCRSTLDEESVYLLTKGLFETARRSPPQSGLPFIDVEQAAATPIPLHAGAARYYRERQLSR